MAAPLNAVRSTTRATPRFAAVFGFSSLVAITGMTLHSIIKGYAFAILREAERRTAFSG
jgi:hypothetical protein